MRRSGAKRADTLTRALALVSFVLFCGQTLLPLVHKVLVQHRLCALHGEWVDVDEAAPTNPDLGHGHGYTPGSERQEHVHCAACSSLHHDQDFALGPVPVELAAHGRNQVALLAADVFGNDGSDRYRMAPKNGPPRLL